MDFPSRLFYLRGSRMGFYSQPNMIYSMLIANRLSVLLRYFPNLLLYPPSILYLHKWNRSNWNLLHGYHVPLRAHLSLHTRSISLDAPILLHHWRRNCSWIPHRLQLCYASMAIDPYSRHSICYRRQSTLRTNDVLPRRVVCS